jgi:hypothetical protein
MKGLLYRAKRWMYRSNRPNRLARVMNTVSALHFSSGLLAPRNWVALEVPGRRTGRVVTFPHFPVDRKAPLDDYARIAARFPVFRVEAA